MNSTDPTREKNPRRNSSGPHPLDAVPLRVPGVETVVGPDGALHLRRPVPPRNRIDALARRIFGSHPEVELAIDPNGRQFWDLVNGRRTLREIAARFSDDFSVSEKQANESVLLFTGVLMQRQFLAVEVAESMDATTIRPSHKP